MNLKRRDSERFPLLQIGTRRCSEQDVVLFIAEEGQANQGDLQLALKMIDIASDCGADGIEFQLAVAEDLYIASHEGYRLYKSREFSTEDIEELISAAHARGLLFHAACLSERLVGVSTALGADVLVVNATDLTNPRMLDAVAESGWPFFLATLMGTLDEIDWAVQRVRSRDASNFALLHGQHIMTSHENAAVPIEYTQLDCIRMLGQRYDVPVGFVDHTTSEVLPAIAASRGAAIVTKHLAPTPGWKGPDWQICLEPTAWKRARAYVDQAIAARGADKTLSLQEVKDRSHHRRGVVAARDIPAGKILEDADIDFKRPGGGLNPRDVEKYLGRRLNRALSTDQLITEGMLEV